MTVLTKTAFYSTYLNRDVYLLISSSAVLIFEGSFRTTCTTRLSLVTLLSSAGRDQDCIINGFADMKVV